MTMTGYGPYKRLTIRTLDAIITITGTNMIATVTDCDGGTPPKDFSIDDASSHTGSLDTNETTRHNELESSDVGESSSTEPLASSDMACASHSSVREEILRQCPLDVPISTVTHKTTVDNDSIKPSGNTDKCGNPDNIGSGTTPSSPISCGSDSNFGESQLCDSSTELGKCGDREDNGDSSERKQSLVLRNIACNSINQVGGYGGNSSTYGNSLDSGLQLQSAATQHSLKKKAVSCDTCGKTFPHPSSLSRHVRMHTGEKPYSCDTCGKTFTQSGHLSKHVLTHTGEKPYSCDICGKSFTQHSTLQRHVRTHTGEKPYLCDTCGKTFTHSSSLSVHVRTHTGEKPYSCDTCGKTFAVSKILYQHVRIHSGEKPYSCDTCGKTFSHSGSLFRHVHIHKGERP